VARDAADKRSKGRKIGSKSKPAQRRQHRSRGRSETGSAHDTQLTVQDHNKGCKNTCDSHKKHAQTARFGAQTLEHWFDLRVLALPPTTKCGSNANAKTPNMCTAQRKKVHTRAVWMHPARVSFLSHNALLLNKSKKQYSHTSGAAQQQGLGGISKPEKGRSRADQICISNHGCAVTSGLLPST